MSSIRIMVVVTDDLVAPLLCNLLHSFFVCILDISLHYFAFICMYLYVFLVALIHHLPLS